MRYLSGVEVINEHRMFQDRFFKEGLIIAAGRVEDEHPVAGGEEDGALVEETGAQDALVGQAHFEPVGLLQRLVGRNAQDPFIRVDVSAGSVEDETAVGLRVLLLRRHARGEFQDAEPTEIGRCR